MLHIFFVLKQGLQFQNKLQNGSYGMILRSQLTFKELVNVSKGLTRIGGLTLVYIFLVFFSQMSEVNVTHMCSLSSTSLLILVSLFTPSPFQFPLFILHILILRFKSF